LPSQQLAADSKQQKWTRRGGTALSNRLEFTMLKHVVFFKFKQGIGEEEIVDLEKSLAELPPVIPEILSYEFGRDVVRSERSYDLALVSAFKDLDAMQHYQKHPDHHIVLQKVNKLCESVLAVDYLTNPNPKSHL
jgi:hypothetical protein